MNGLRDVEAKEFIKLMDSLCGRHNRWEIWKDAMWLFATTISNAVDPRHREKREQQYLDIAKRYSKAEMDTFAELFAQLVLILERKRGYCDFLGELYMMLGLGNDAGGQFFTPYDVCRMMAKVTMSDVQEKVAQQGWISVNDPACGAGATLIAAADIMYNDYKLNFQTSVMFAGQDIDYTTGLMCYIQLSLCGCAGYVHIGNTLTNPMTGHVLFGDEGENTWYTPMYFSAPWEMRRQAVLMRRLFSILERPATSDEPEPQEPPKPAEPEPAIIQVTGKKARGKPQGQLMFEI